MKKNMLIILSVTGLFSTLPGFAQLNDGTTRLYQPYQALNTTYEDSKLIVSDGWKNGHPTIFIKEKLLQEINEVSLVGGEIKQIDFIQAFPKIKTLIVSGKISATRSSVAIISLETRKVTDEFLVSNLQVSPNGEYIIFSRFFPEHDGRGNQTSCYATYYTGRDLSNNRPLELQMAAHVYDKRIDVGTQIYPVARKLMSDERCTDIDEDAAGNFLLSNRFFWSKDSRSFSFVNQKGNNANLIVGKLNAFGYFDIYSTPLYGALPLCGTDPCTGSRVTVAYTDNDALEVYVKSGAQDSTKKFIVKSAVAAD